MDTTVDRRSTTAAPGRAAPGRDRAVTLAGALLAATGIGIVLSTITNEALYPAQRHYTTFADTISSLSGTEPPDSYIVQPNRLIFIVTMAVAGVLVLAATALLRHAVRRRLVIALAVFGTGLLGIAVFPGDVATWHPIFAMACFVGGAIAAILSRTLLDRPLRAFAVALGSVALAATVLGLDFFADLGPQTAIGIGGVERWIAYPVLLWMVLFGAALMTVGARRTRRVLPELEPPTRSDSDRPRLWRQSATRSARSAAAPDASGAAPRSILVTRSCSTMT